MKVWELMNILSRYNGDEDVNDIPELNTPEKTKEEEPVQE